MNCAGYAANKFTRQFKTGFKLSIMFIILPALVQSYRKLLKNEDGVRKKTLIKFIRSTFYLAIFGALPACLMCVCSRGLGMKMGKGLNILTMGLGGFIAYLFETPNRHVQLLSFMLPKAIETLFNLLAIKGLYRARDWHAQAVAVFAWAIIACSALKENLER